MPRGWLEGAGWAPEPKSTHPTASGHHPANNRTSAPHLLQAGLADSLFRRVEGLQGYREGGAQEYC